MQGIESRQSLKQKEKGVSERVRKTSNEILSEKKCVNLDYNPD